MPSPPDVIAFTKSSIPTGPLSSLNLGELNPNYFANKRNIFNVIFVKRAWGWTTLCFLVHWTSGLVTEYLASPTTIPSRTALNGVAGIEKDALDARERDTSNVRRKAVIWRPLARYILATTYWLLCELDPPQPPAVSGTWGQGLNSLLLSHGLSWDASS